MRQVMVRYTVRPDHAEENIRLVGEMFASLQREAPPGVTYSTYRLEDGVSFIHVATMLDEHNNPLRKIAAFNAFTANVRDRCEAPPVTTVLHEIGKYSG